MSFRSTIGAELAVKVGADLAIKFLDGLRSSVPSAVKCAAERLLPRDIVAAWKEEISEHVRRNPFTPDELERLEREAGSSAKVVLLREGHDSSLAYGATLLLVGIAEGFIFYLQLGDGDILAVSDRSGQVENPLPQDSSLLANETTSLCMDDAQQMFRFRFQYIQDLPPALILVSTDGYSNSFSTPDGFCKVGTDLLEMIQVEGLDPICDGLPAWLEEASHNGSGDDVTLGILCRSDIIGTGRPQAGSQLRSAGEQAPSDRATGVLRDE